MPTINVSELIQDPDFAQEFTVERKRGSWVQGRFEFTTQTLKRYGVIIPDAKVIVQTPEGDTIKGAINVYSLEQINTTVLAKNSSERDQVSDEVIWRGESYKVMSVDPYVDFGYYHALAIRKRGA